MKRNLLLALSVLAFGLQSVVVQASPYPADAEASFDLPALSTYADAAWGVSERKSVQQHDAFPFGGGPVDD